MLLAAEVISIGGMVQKHFLSQKAWRLKNTAKLDPFVPSVKELKFYINYTVYANKGLQGGNNTDPSTTILEPVYTVRSLLLSALAVPFYYLGLVLSVSPIVTVGLLVNSLFISLTSVVIFCISVEVHRSKRIGFLLSLIFSVCSFVWPYNTTFWVQPLQGLTLALAAFFIIKIQHYNRSFLCHYTVLGNDRKRVYFGALASLFLGLSVFAHPTSLIFVPAFLIYSFFSVMRHNIKNFIFFVAILSIVLFSVGLVNYARFGSFTEFGYGYFSSLATHNGWRGLIGLLISPGAGLVFYFPLAILLPLGAKYMYKENKGLFFLCTTLLLLTGFMLEPYLLGLNPLHGVGV